MGNESQSICFDSLKKICLNKTIYYVFNVLKLKKKHRKI